MTDIYYDGKIRISTTTKDKGKINRDKNAKSNIDKLKLTIYKTTGYKSQIEFEYDRHNLEYKLDKMLTSIERYNKQHGGNLIKTQYPNNKTRVGTYRIDI